MKRSFFFLGVVLLAFFAFVRTARAEPLRIVVAVGHRAGLPGETPLKHSLRDATRVRDVFVQLGDTRPENAILLNEPTSAGTPIRRFVSFSGRKSGS